MNDKALADVKREMKRLQERLAELDACMKPAPREGGLIRHYGGGCPETAAVRRASMDLTRALAKLRRA